MKSLWKEAEAVKYQDNPINMRVYTSRLIGQDPDLVLHGGGNTSVKVKETNIFGETEDLIYVKGSGWDLATIEAPGFAPVKLKVLQQAAELEALTDTQMVKLQRSAMTDPGAPNPSVEAILHAIIPFTYVDHTHADAVVTVSNTPDGEAKIREIYGDHIMIVPYVMPGFILAKTIYEMARNLDWSTIDAMILMNHGVFTFHDDARESYERMIRIVDQAESYLQKHATVAAPSNPFQEEPEELLTLATIRGMVSRQKGSPVICRWNSDPENVSFSALPDVRSIATRGPLTPDHVIRTKRIPMILDGPPEADVEAYRQDYQSYFDRNNPGELTMLDPAPRWIIWPDHGTLTIGKNFAEAKIIDDITAHTIKAIRQAEAMEGWQALPEKDIFEVEYWELEQAKLRKGGTAPEFQGKIALVTGAASGIGKACTEMLAEKGAVVAALDIDERVKDLFSRKEILGIPCDVSDKNQLEVAVHETIRRFGGLDIVISNAGIFPDSATLGEMKPENWEKSLAVNLTSHQQLLTICHPYLQNGIDPAVIIVGSKNVPAPGPGAGAYSVAKAGLTQMARLAALEWGKDNIRINVLHPNAVYDTAIWTDEVLEKRAAHYGLSVEAYKTNNLLKIEVSSKDVAALACSMAGPAFAKTTGAQIPVDGGNDRVI